ncbi:protein DEFECTIVE IN MERISTEM SILENCING 3-like isoform X1 [Amaranthus tricolor]|uniref:protein DEFECTIVE IN MERISTEM SILENCING 3-like isoform X1 n=2 Tax=Amaranthus tricolor TaxID=29722 RepID=UPI0025886592|nr:protein DEFECTIVE IN MERISTEM SILENCING 3-like isoform X1 [Amaranthus tricolor]
MFPTHAPAPLNTQALVVQNVPALQRADSSNAFLNNGNDVPNETLPFANNLMSSSKRLQDELENSGSKLKQHEDNLKFLKTQQNQLDDAILDLQVSLGKYISSGAPKTQDGDNSQIRSEAETIEQILKHENSAAGIYCQFKNQLSNITFFEDVLGVVASLGKVEDDNLSRLFSEYLGLQTMLAIVCKTSEGVKALEIYDGEGIVNKGSGIYGLGASVGRDLKGRFSVICLENLRPYAGEFLSKDPQRRLDIPKPRLPSGDIPSGFLGYAVNMIHVDRPNIFCLTSSGWGLRETLFYSLFSRLQVYKTRAEMLLALPCICDGAVSLDGGMIRSTGVFYLGSREDIDVRFPKCSIRTSLPDKYFELENQIQQKKWEKERLQQDMRREQALLDQENANFKTKKQNFLQFLAESSTFMAQHQMQTASIQNRQVPR